MSAFFGCIFVISVVGLGVGIFVGASRIETQLKKLVEDLDQLAEDMDRLAENLNIDTDDQAQNLIDQAKGKS